MNPATEIILRWFFADAGLEHDIAEELLAVLKAGAQEGEADSLAAIRDYVSQASERPREVPYDRIIPAALAIHHETEELNSAADVLGKMQEIDRILAHVPSSDIGKKVVANRIRELLSSFLA